MAALVVPRQHFLGLDSLLFQKTSVLFRIPADSILPLCLNLVTDGLKMVFSREPWAQANNAVSG